MEEEDPWESERTGARVQMRMRIFAAAPGRSSPSTLQRSPGSFAMKVAFLSCVVAQPTRASLSGRVWTWTAWNGRELFYAGN